MRRLVRRSCDQPSPIVDFEFHQTFVSHFQEEGLTSFLIHHIGAFHDLADFERLLAERAQDFIAIIQHEQFPLLVIFDCFFSRRP